jgi:hypothetical protein
VNHPVDLANPSLISLSISLRLAEMGHQYGSLAISNKSARLAEFSHQSDLTKYLPVYMINQAIPGPITGRAM